MIGDGLQHAGAVGEDARDLVVAGGQHEVGGVQAPQVYDHQGLGVGCDVFGTEDELLDDLGADRLVLEHVPAGELGQRALLGHDQAVGADCHLRVGQEVDHIDHSQARVAQLQLVHARAIVQQVQTAISQVYILEGELLQVEECAVVHAHDPVIVDVPQLDVGIVLVGDCDDHSVVSEELGLPIVAWDQ